MATVDETGVRIRSLAQWNALLNQRFTAAFGPDVADDPELPQAQMNGIVALQLAEEDEATAALGNAHSVDHSLGVQQDDLGTLLNIQRIDATRSRVTATVAGVAGTTIPASSRARTATGTEFRTLSAVVLRVGGVAVEMEAVDEGAVELAAGALTHIVTVIPGWETITNAAAATVGRPRQTNTRYRQVYTRRTARLAVGPLDALEAGVIEAGADDVQAVENDTNVPVVIQGWEVQGHSSLTVAREGTAAAINEAIRLHKGMGSGLMTAHLGGTHATLSNLQNVTAGTFEFGERSFSALDLSGAADLPAVAAAVQAVIRGTTDMLLQQTYVAYHHAEGGGYFVVGFPVRPSGVIPAFDAGAVAVALGLAPALASDSPGRYIRARARPLTVTANVTLRSTFPADGLQQMKVRLLAVVEQYRIGDQPWPNDFLAALEGVAGTRVTSLSVQDAGVDVGMVTVPLETYYTLAEDAIMLTTTSA